MKRDERKDDFFWENVSEPSNPPDELAQKCFEKNPSGRIIPLFFFGRSESYRVFNCLHDSNSIFRAGGIISETFFGRTVTVFYGFLLGWCLTLGVPECLRFDLGGEFESSFSELVGAGSCQRDVWWTKFQSSGTIIRQNCGIVQS